MILSMKKMAVAGAAAVVLTSVTALGTAHAENKASDDMQKVAAKTEAKAETKSGKSGEGKEMTGQEKAAKSECVADINEMQSNYRESNVRYNAELRGDVRTLREAAYTLAYNGDEEGCRWLLEKIETMRTDASEDGAKPAELQQKRMERLETAQKLAEMKGAVRAEMLLGADVVNMQDEDLGAVEDVVLNGEGKPSYVLISHGGLFGVGADLTPVSIGHLKKIEGEDTLVLDISEEKFDEAPEYDEEQARTTGLEKWSDDIEAWWKKNIG